MQLHIRCRRCPLRNLALSREIQVFVLVDRYLTGSFSVFTTYNHVPIPISSRRNLNQILFDMDAALLSEISGTDCHIAGLDKNQKCSAQCDPRTCSHNLETRRDSAFLVLAPITSDNYSAQQSSPSASRLGSSSITSPVVEPVKKERRSSSTGSTGAFSKRYLKLSPIHGGGEPGVADYVDVEEA